MTAGNDCLGERPMLALVIALSILALIILVAASMELVGRLSVNFLDRWRAGAARSARFESKERLGLIVERRQLPIH
jgi:hypothetical protein